MTELEGPLARLSVEPGADDGPARYELAIDDGRVPLNRYVGGGLEIEFLGCITCRHCAAATRRSYAQGYCYRCFKTLARCDLCVVSPDRCHYHHGTCREPEWGDAFCMTPHVVYLANSSGAKVGITRAGQELGRWLDQGASQGLVVAAAATRRDAGLAEVQLALHLADRTDWRRLVSGDAPDLDLRALRETLRGRLVELPPGARWLESEVRSLNYPVLRYPRRIIRLGLDTETLIRGNLVGIKGQYLLFDQGTFNVRQHTSYHVRVRGFSEPLATDEDDQMELFE